VLVAANVQDPPSPNDPLELEVKLTLPVGLEAKPASMSLIDAVHVDA
jgi:hypothetical protein